MHFIILYVLNTKILCLAMHIAMLSNTEAYSHNLASLDNDHKELLMLYLSDLSAACTLAKSTSTSDGSSFMYSSQVNCIANGDL